MYVLFGVLYLIFAIMMGTVFEASKQYQGRRFAALRCYAWGAIWPITIVLIVLENI
jgi:hypothetical protein